MESKFVSLSGCIKYLWLWKDLRLSKTEEAGKAMLHLQLIISRLIQQYAQSLRDKFSLLMKDDQEVRITQDEARKGHVETTWAFINSVSILSEHVDKIFRDLKYTEFIEKLIDETNFEMEDKQHSKPGLLIKISLENIVEDMVRRLMRKEVQRLFDKDGNTNENNQVGHQN